jgi:chromate transporter
MSGGRVAGKFVGEQSGRGQESATSLGEIARLFGKLGTIAFGGPAAHIAMMEDEVVRRRRWLTSDQFLDYLGATNLIPGPNSTELATHIGHARRGWPGLLVAGMAFITPASLIVAAVAWGYVRYRSLPEVEGLLYGVKPVVIAVVAQALWSLGRTAVKSGVLAIIGIAATVSAAAGIHELVVLAATGALTAFLHRASGVRQIHVVSLLPGAWHERAPLTAVGTVAISTSMTAASLWPLFLVFAKAGAVLFGSGYVLLAFLRADLVERLGWLSESQLLDAVAIGQVTPGPVFTTATFIGYVLAGPTGAMVATVGIFLPAFIFVALSGPLVPRLRRSPMAGVVLDGVNVASLALMAAVSWQLGRAALLDAVTVALALVSLIALVYFRINSAYLIAAGAAIGWIAS